MSRKPTTKKDAEKVSNTLRAYHDIITLIKNDLAAKITEAAGKNTLNISIEELPRLLAVINSCVTTQGANGYEQLTRVLK